MTSRPPSSEAGERIASRKDDHLDIVLRKDVASRGELGFGRFTLEYDALPEIDLEAVDLGTTIFGRRLAAPIFVGAMTGGSARAADINAKLARAAAEVGLGMALGSQRAMIVDEALAPSFDVRAHAPSLPLLFGNVGGVQLNYGVDAAAIARAVSRVSADALNVHLNPLQEAVQPEGDTRFSGLAAAIGELARASSVPVLVKEVGAGLSARTLAKLAALPIAGVEIAGTGGTSWARVESHRAADGSAQSEIGRRLAGFGVPVPEGIVLARRALGDRLVIASGGIRTGLDVAVALALGADAVALAAPFLVAAERGEDALLLEMQTLVAELRVIAFCVGAADVAALRATPVIARVDDPLIGVASQVRRGFVG